MALPGGGWEGGARGGSLARGRARERERGNTRGVGANNLIEPIDARPVFTAFSATLPRSFYSNPPRASSVPSFARFSSLSARSRASALPTPVAIVSIIGPERGQTPTFFPLFLSTRSLDTSFSNELFLTRATGSYAPVLDTASPPSRRFASTFLFLLLSLRSYGYERARRGATDVSAECFKAA